MLLNKLKDYQIVLASKSPRRQQLLKKLGIDFDVKHIDIEESFPENLKKENIALYLCELKASAYNMDELRNNCLVITADTIVCLDDTILNKPDDADEAMGMLSSLSGREHTVITGVCLRTKSKMSSFFATTKVWFKELTVTEINYYVSKYKPFDKAGAYGIQEWIGHMGIEKIEGSYFNVVGLPVQRLYTEMENFLAV